MVDSTRDVTQRRNAVRALSKTQAGATAVLNLARNGHRVLLLEAGEDKGKTQNYQVPAFHPLSTEDPSMRWDYFVKNLLGAEPPTEYQIGKPPVP